MEIGIDIIDIRKDKGIMKDLYKVLEWNRIQILNKKCIKNQSIVETNEICTIINICDNIEYLLELDNYNIEYFFQCLTENDLNCVNDYIENYYKNFDDIHPKFSSNLLKIYNFIILFLSYQNIWV